MMPTVDERLASVVRSLSEVVLPHLPPEASLAQEQVQLCIGHLQILRAQIDGAPEFEREELEDARAISRDLLAVAAGGSATTAAVTDLTAVTDAADDGAADAHDVRRKRRQIHDAIDALVAAVAQDGTSRDAITQVILRHEADRALKDRRWFAPFGFDTLED